MDAIEALIRMTLPCAFDTNSMSNYCVFCEQTKDSLCHHHALENAWRLAYGLLPRPRNRTSGRRPLMASLFGIRDTAAHCDAGGLIFTECAVCGRAIMQGCGLVDQTAPRWWFKRYVVALKLARRARGE